MEECGHYYTALVALLLSTTAAAAITIIVKCRVTKSQLYIIGNPLCR